MSVNVFCIKLHFFFFPACLDAPEKENSSGPGGDDDPRGWWFSDVKAHSFSAQQQCEESLGLDESVTAVRETVKDQGPFDGILGFSQGAAFVAMLCSLQEQNLEPEFNFRFAILVAGFRSACTEHDLSWIGFAIAPHYLPYTCPGTTDVNSHFCYNLTPNIFPFDFVLGNVLLCTALYK